MPSRKMETFFRKTLSLETFDSFPKFAFLWTLLETLNSRQSRTFLWKNIIWYVFYIKYATSTDLEKNQVFFSKKSKLVSQKKTFVLRYPTFSIAFYCKCAIFRFWWLKNARSKLSSIGHSHTTWKISWKVSIKKRSF